ncbi:hypothetical protein J437_LFUL005306 [Ladona fulva]|uniref:Uncharacterized protein n=1 Tax=Ladona fulva TaxID=123851 RepID=A0A8K0P0H4_LADFU|nr:hypothetical protein J437_LFUL005306 [Ladona fulva]
MEAEKVGLKVNCPKTQCLFSSRKSTIGNDNFIELNGNKYERCDKFNYSKFHKLGIRFSSLRWKERLEEKD